MAMRVWAGRILTALPILGMAFSGIVKILQPKEVMEAFTGQFGYPASTVVPIGVLELTCIALYAFPRTAALGAVLVTAYLGGAVATHVRVGDAFVGPVVLGVMAWGGLYFRDERVRALLPLR